MTRFLLSFADAEREIEAIKSLAAPFLHRTSSDIFNDLKRQLDNIKLDRFRANQWSIDLDRPLRTNPCGGAYQRGDRGRHDVYAAISWVWCIQPYARQPTRLFEITDNASCLVRLLEGPDDGTHELGRFNIDVGLDDGPGSIFHAQVNGQREGAFPSTLDVPRFPVPILTPASVIDFVLGELFQEQWLKRVTQHSNSHTIWTGLQRKRLVNYLDWQLQILCGRRGDPSASPLMDLKRSGAEAQLFLDGFHRIFALNC